MIRISRRGKIGLSALATVIVAGALAALIVVPLGLFSHGVHASPRVATVSFTGTRGTISPTRKSPKFPKPILVNKTDVACTNDTTLPKPANCGLGGGDTASKAAPKRPAPNTKFNGRTGVVSTARAPKTTAMNIASTVTGAVTNNFNGVSNDDNATTNGFVLTPPDQGLCTGLASAINSVFGLGVPGTNTVVVEPVNESVRIYNPSGSTLFGPFSLATLFNDAGSDGDVSCQYDLATQTFFFTEIGTEQTGPDTGAAITDIAVINASGYASYQLDTSVNDTCFPDFPHQGYNANAFYITANLFDCGPASDGFYAGAGIWGLSKSQLVARDASVNFVSFGTPGLSLNSTQTLAIAPAFGDSSSAEYMVNSFPYDQFGNSNSIANTLGFWTVTNGISITTGSGMPALTGRVINSETYAFPQLAASTGSGSVFNSFEESERFLNPDDDRMEQLQLLNTSQGPELFAALDTAVNIGGDPTARDGAAWFEFNPTTKTVGFQGYISLAGTYIVYPSILAANNGTAVVDFSMTSPTLNPSTGYAFAPTIQFGGPKFSGIKTTALGSSSHYSFSDVLDGEARWGDYSAAALDPSGDTVWVADEYIPATSTNGFDNWGTEVWSVSN